MTPYKPYEAENDIRAQRIQSLQQLNGWTYPFAENTYNDIREHELKCLADRNKEWHYDGGTNTGTCTLKSFTPYEPYVPDHDIRAQVHSFSQVRTSKGWTYPFGEHTYNDIRAQELKCLANRNYEWHYDAATNTGSCTQNNLTPYKPYEAENDIRAQSSSAAELSIKNGWVYPFGQNAYNDIRA